ncbi:hypothetical protein EYF80_012377 [Liparis tanakae]|uniref:Uncharacterized protein n=1 Tax=Liparis tanakae TaxID=230148 RepID=A0A4Z2IJT1_9TELE|nr:hypothetical protein EYF80_012377 [Liparis tanakae]
MRKQQNKGEGREDKIREHKSTEDSRYVKESNSSESPGSWTGVFVRPALRQLLSEDNKACNEARIFSPIDTLQEATEGSLLLDILPAHRHCDAQHHDHHQKEAADHPCCDQRGSEKKTSKGEKKEGGQLVDDEETDENESVEMSSTLQQQSSGQLDSAFCYLDKAKIRDWSCRDEMPCCFNTSREIPLRGENGRRREEERAAGVGISLSRKGEMVEGGCGATMVLMVKHPGSLFVLIEGQSFRAQLASMSSALYRPRRNYVADCLVFFVTKLSSVTQCVHLFPSALFLLEL